VRPLLSSNHPLSSRDAEFRQQQGNARHTDLFRALARLYMLDESSLASTLQLHESIHRLHPNTRERRQREAIEAGWPFVQLQEAVTITARINEILRQKDPELRRCG
jgi:hypothetical protein